MADIDFPIFPRLESDSWVREDFPTLDRTEFDDGFVQQSTRYARTRSVYLVKYYLPSFTEKMRFEEFVVSIGRGARRFNWTPPDGLQELDGLIVQGVVTYSLVGYQPQRSYMAVFKIEVYQ